MPLEWAQPLRHLQRRSQTDGDITAHKRHHYRPRTVSGRGPCTVSFRGRAEGGAVPVSWAPPPCTMGAGGLQHVPEGVCALFGIAGTDSPENGAPPPPLSSGIEEGVGGGGRDAANPPSH